MIPKGHIEQLLQTKQERLAKIDAEKREIDMLIRAFQDKLGGGLTTEEIMIQGSGGYSRSQVETAIQTAKLPERFPDPRVGMNKDDPAYRPEAMDGLREAMKTWIKSDFVLQTPHRAAHKGVAAMNLYLARYRGEDRVAEQPLAAAGMQIIMVEHDWGRLFSGATFEGGSASGEWKLPYENQAFEFAISGAAVLGLCHSQSDHASLTLGFRPPGRQEWLADGVGVGLRGDSWGYVSGKPHIEAGNSIVNERFEKLYEFIFRQIRAVCIMLESEVAETQAVRAPYKTNREPTAAKPLPSLSHHVVRLNRNSRPAPLPSSEVGDGRQRRLHFRRGHWRHYAAHKTWIKWMLVGNPDLGFVDKDYRA